MKKIRLGKTELMVTKPALGCLPIQRRDKDEAVRILRRACDAGINYYDTANAYSDSEEKIGLAFDGGMRKNVIISTKSMGRDKKTVMEHLDRSLRMMKTDYIDLFQFHCVPEMPDPDDPNGAFAAVKEYQQKGYIRHVGVTAHKLELSFELVASGLFETMQYPFSYISAPRELELVEKCAEADVGFIGMKGLAGGILTNSRICHAFCESYENVVPIWGVQTMEELEDWIRLADENPRLDDEMRSIIERERKELAGGFCRSCGYCMPCPAGIEIPMCGRMNKLLRRAPWQQFMTDEIKAKMEKINECQECGQCKSQCPYELDTPNLLKFMLEDYTEFYKEHAHLI